MKHIIIILNIVYVSAIIPSCGNKKNQEEGGHSHHSGHADTKTTTLTAEQIKSIKVRLGKLEKKQLTASLKANGLLKVPHQNKAAVTAIYGGVVKSILVQPGSSVSSGQVIATISNPSFITMQEEFLSASAKEELMEAEFESQKTLIKGNASSLKNFQLAESEFKAAKARKAALQKKLEMTGINTAALSSENIQSVIGIRSPISGAVSHVSVNIGSFAEANFPIAEIVDHSQLHLDLYVYEKDLDMMKVGQTIHFTLTNNPGREYDAKIFGISNTFEPHTKAIAVHASVVGDKTNLIDGMNITALVSLENAMLDAVPSEAIVNYENQDYIFIVKNSGGDAHHHGGASAHTHGNDEHTHEAGTIASGKGGSITFEKIPVRKGTTDLGYSEITVLKSISPDAQIVTGGAFFILAKMTNQGEAHVH